MGRSMLSMISAPSERTEESAETLWDVTIGSLGGSGIQASAPLQYGVADIRQRLTQGHEQRLGPGHTEWRRIIAKKLFFKHTGLNRADHLAERIRYGLFQTRVTLDRDEMRVILSESWQHPRVHLAVEIVHQERAKDGDV